MPAQPFESFLTQVKTADDTERIREALDALLIAMYKTDTQSVPEKMDSVLPSHVSEAIKEEMKNSSITVTNIEEVKRLLTHLKDMLSRLRTVSLTLAFDPPQKTIDALSGTVKKMFGADTVIEISVQPQILGGALIVANGRYVDKSLKRKLDILFDVKKDEIMKMLTNQTKPKEAKNQL